MPINTLYDTWKMRIQELRPGQRITQIRGFVWLVIGIYLSRSVCLSRIACKMPGEAKLTSATRRLSRLLDNLLASLLAIYRTFVNIIDRYFSTPPNIHRAEAGKSSSTLSMVINCRSSSSLLLLIIQRREK